MKENAKEAILAAAKEAAMAYGYGGLNFRDLAETVGIKAASINYHFPNKALLGEAVAKRYWEDIAVDLDAIAAEAQDPVGALRRYPEIFRKSLENDNRICLGNVAWLGKQLTAAGVVNPEQSEPRARAIYAAIAGAQIVARSRSDISLFDSLVESYRAAGLLPA
jgi:TetR/AcrR family transcriptional repressor of nem operon